MMGFRESLETVYRKKYATIKGRASRSEYWWFQLFSKVVLAITLIGGYYFTFSSETEQTGELTASSIIGLILLLLGVIFFFGSLVPSICLVVRRFHDRNLSGWIWLLMAVCAYVPYVGLLVSLASLVITILRGTNGFNQYGPDPLSGTDEALEVVFE